MKWQTLSEAGSSLIGQLAEDSRRWLRRGKMLRSLRKVGGLGEPAAIPPISYYLYDDDSAVAEEAAVVIHALMALLPPDLLPALDHRLRAESYYGFQSKRWRTGPIDLIERFRAAPTYASALGVASSHASGYVRQAAVETLDREITSDVEIPFLILRLDDWVPAVRQAAEEALARRIHDSHRRAYRQALPVIVQLRNRLRAGESPALARIEDLLRADAEALIDSALAFQNRRARRFGLSLAFEALNDGDVETGGRILERVIASDDPAARLHLARWLTAPPTVPVLQRRFLPRLLDDRFVAVRRIALGWCATHDPLSHRATLRGALLDQSRSIRSIAQFHLPKLEAIDLRSFYCEAVRSSGRASLKGALGGLGDKGAAPDAELAVPLLDAPEPKIRRAALGALAKLALETHFELFVRALQSGSPGVSRQARIALDRHALRVGADRLASIFAKTQYPHVRRQTLSLISRLSKWQALPLLIEIFGGSETSTRKSAENFLQDWLWNYNRTHNIQPTQAEIARVRQAMTTEGLTFEGRLGMELRAIVKSL